MAGQVFLFMLFFFFQAEDGIRDVAVTGVQTCALPIFYDPTPCLAVARLAVGPDGVLGEGPEGSWLVDVHHRTHPNTKNEDGAHGVSIGFTTHYALMRERARDRPTPAIGRGHVCTPVTATPRL